MQIVMLAILFVFALVHSGLAGLRASGEKLVGERAYRVFFAGVSLPLAVSAVVCFYRPTLARPVLCRFLKHSSSLSRARSEKLSCV